MKIMQVVTDYIKASLLTTKGDIIKHNGVSPKKLGIGTASQLLRVNALADDLEYFTDVPELDILTTKGDLVKQGSAAIPQRFGIGTAGQIIRVNAVPDDLEYQNPGDFLYEDIYQASNGSPVSLDAGGVTILTINLGNVGVDDRFNIVGLVHFLNSGSATGCRIELVKDSGTASHKFLYNQTALLFPGYVENANSFHANLGTLLSVLAAGTLVIGVKGIGNTDCEVPAQACQVIIHRMKKG